MNDPFPSDRGAWADLRLELANVLELFVVVSVMEIVEWKSVTG